MSSSTTPNVNTTPTHGPGNIPSLTLYFQTTSTPFTHLSATILPRQHPSAVRAFFTYQLRGSPLRSRSATHLIFHSRVFTAPTPAQPQHPFPLHLDLPPLQYNLYASPLLPARTATTHF